MLNREKLNNLAGEIWKSAERLRGKFKAYEYQSVVLPIIVIRRIECVLIDWREKKQVEIQARRPDIQGEQLDEMVKKLELSQHHFSNNTHWTLSKITREDPTLMEGNFRDYIKGFSDNVQDIIDHFDYRAIIGKMKKNGRLGPILRQYADSPLGPEQLSNLEMGYIYEELLRRFSEQSGEEAGEHFTPREVIRLMVELLDVQVKDRHVSIYDPACGTGGMLSVAKEHMLDRTDDTAERQRLDGLITLHGHELQPQNYAICKADMLIKNDTHAEICFGNSLIPHDPAHEEPGDQLAGADDHFGYMLSNPPFGVTWGGKDGYQAEAEKYRSSRYKAGMPRSNDGALLFLQTMLVKMKPLEQGGSRIAIIFNGDCGSGESEIRRWILENDWLDAIVMLPDQLFYNTGIYTYIWLLTNNKPPGHQGRVMLVDAREQFDKEPKSFGNKRNRILDSHREWIEVRCRKGWVEGYNDDKVKLFKTTDFSFHKVSVVFWQTDENDQPATLTERYEKAFTAANIKKEQEFYDSELHFRIALYPPLPVGEGRGERREISFILKPKDSFTRVYEAAVKNTFADEIEALTKEIDDTRVRNKAIKAFIKALQSEVEFTHRHYIRDNEYIPYGENIEIFLEREIKNPIIRWQDAPQPGYEILPNKYFYHYQPPKPADELLKEFWVLEKEAEGILAQLEGSL